MSLRKSKTPAAFFIGEYAYIRIDTINELVDKASKHSIKAFKKQANETLQRGLDEGRDVDVRAYKAMIKERAQNLKELTRSIKFTLNSVVK